MKKIISKFLLASLILSIASTAIGCGGDKTSTGTSTNDTSNVAVDTETIVEEVEVNADNILDRFERTSFDGKEFRIVGSRYFNASIGGRQISDGELNGEVLNDALHNRDQKLEEYFDINIVYNVIENEETCEIAPLVSQNVAAGEDIADLVWGSIDMAMKPLLLNDCLTDLLTVPNLDLSNEWWQQTVTEDLSIGGKVFFASGNITPRVTTSAFIMAFNKKLIGNYQIEDPYVAVREGQWTLDRLQTICNDMYQDLDESGSQSDKDFYGFVFEGGSQNALFTSVGGTIYELQDDGTPILTANDAKNINIIERLSEMIQTDDFYSPTINYVANQIFRESRALFLSFACCDLSMLRDMEDDYGILPQPKLDERQENYFCTANRWIGTGIAVPKSLPESEYERVGLLTEAMAALSTYTSYEAQYETIMQAKYVRDPESIEMLRLAVDSARFDMGSIYGWGGLQWTIDGIMINGGSIVSTIEAQKTVANAEMEKFMETITGFEQ